MNHVRNIAVLLALALGVYALPGGGSGADLIAALLSLIITALIVAIAGRGYRERRVDIYGLGDVDRAVLYVAIGAILVVLAASGSLLATTAGTLAFAALLAVCAAALMRVYRNWQRY